MKEVALCFKCKSFNAKDRTLSCPTANSMIEFCRNRKVNAIIIRCKEFEKRVSFDVVQFEGVNKEEI